MRVNELRIGNIVKCEGVKGFALDAIEFSEGNGYTLIMFALRGNGRIAGRIEIPINMAQPVPLTEEIILKCGFGEVGFYDNVYHHGYFRVYLDKKANQGLVKYENDTNNLEIEISSVHQLQNLYFAMTGEELDVKF